MHAEFQCPIKLLSSTYVIIMLHATIVSGIMMYYIILHFNSNLEDLCMWIANALLHVGILPSECRAIVHAAKEVGVYPREYYHDNVELLTWLPSLHATPSLSYS